MDVFITTLKRFNLYSSLELQLINETLHSVCSQTQEDYKVLIVVHQEDIWSWESRYNLSITCVPVAFVSRSLDFMRAPVSIDNESYESLRIDRGCKHLVGILYARQYNPNFIVPFDADDLLSPYYLEVLRRVNPSNGWFLPTGKVLECATGKSAISNKFDHLCGTCYAVRAKLYDFPSCKPGLNQEQIIDQYGGMYVKKILGSHRYVKGFFDLEPYFSEELVTYRKHKNNLTRSL